MRLGSKRGNQGFTLVEVLCAVAIFSMLASIVAGVVTVSARFYRNGVSDTSLQQEAQYLTNQVGNLVKDATKVGVNGTQFMIYTTDTNGYVLSLPDDGNNRLDYATFTVDADNNINVSGFEMFAEHVQNFTLTPDVDFEKTRAVNLSLDMVNGDKTYSMDYTMTARNEVVQRIEFNTIPEASIDCETEICMVPGETLALPVSVSGETGGISIECADGVSVDHNDYSQSAIPEHIQITLDKKVKDQTKMLTIKTKNVIEGSTTPLDTVVVCIRVRRINTITVSHTCNQTDYESTGAVFTFYSDANIYNRSQRVGEDWDRDWKQPAAVEWSATLKVGGVEYSDSSSKFSEYFRKVNEENDAVTPTVQYELLQNMPVGLELTVKATSLHRKGQNKGNVVYCDTAGEDKDIYGTDTVKASTEALIDCHIMRATETVLIKYSDTYITFNRHNYAQLNVNGVYQDHFFRYREIGTSWSNMYHIMKGSLGEFSVQLTQQESLLLDPNKEYEIEVIRVVYNPNTKKVLWPADTSILEEGKGWYEAGYTKGWTDSDPWVSDPSGYKENFYVGASSIVFDANDLWGVTAGSKTFGNYGKDNPIPLPHPNNSRTTIGLLTQYYNVQKMLTHYRGAIQKLNTTNNTWETIVDGSSYSGMESTYGFFVNMANSYGTAPENYDKLSSYEICNIHSDTTGTYRILPRLENTDFYTQSGDLMNPVYTLVPTTFNLYKDETDSCVIYFTLNKK